MITSVTALLVALGASALLVRSAHTHRPSLLDDRSGGPQKFHAREAPRVGGLAIALGLMSALAILAFRDGYAETARWGFLLALAGVPPKFDGLAPISVAVVDGSRGGSTTYGAPSAYFAERV